MEDRTRKMMDELIERSGNAYVCSVDEAGYPLVKCMFARGKSGNQFYFSSNLSSRRTGQFLRNSKSSVYFCDEANFQAVLLSGEMEVLTDLGHRRMIWREGDEQYYPDRGGGCGLLRAAPHRAPGPVLSVSCPGESGGYGGF